MAPTGAMPRPFRPCGESIITEPRGRICRWLTEASESGGSRRGGRTERRGERRWKRRGERRIGERRRRG